MMSKKNWGSVLVVVILAAASVSTAAAQVGVGVRHVPTTDGLDVVGPAGGQSFRMQIRGDNAQRLRTKKKYWYRADGVRFEFFSEEIGVFTPTDVPRRLDDRAVLEMYRTEIERRRFDDKVRSTWAKFDGRTAMLLTLEKKVAMPDGGYASERELFLVIVGPGSVFGLFAPVPAGQSDEVVRRMLIRTLGTLRFED